MSDENVIFDLREAAIALIKAKGIHEGRWQIGFEINMSGGLFGPSADEVRPGAFFQFTRILLSRHVEGVAPSFVVDAAEVNPLQPTRGGEAAPEPKTARRPAHQKSKK